MILAAAVLLAQVGFPLFSADFPPEEFAKRRAAVFDAIGKDAVAILQGAPTPVGYARFRQSNDFYYLSGVEAPNAYLLLDPVERRTTLYLPHRKERRELGEGKVLIVITEKGRDVLSNFVPRDMVAIERVMKEEGLLERYPRAD